MPKKKLTKEEIAKKADDLYLCIQTAFKMADGYVRDERMDKHSKEIFDEAKEHILVARARVAELATTSYESLELLKRLYKALGGKEDE